MYAARYGFFRYLRFVKSNVQQMTPETTNTPLSDSSPRATRPSQDAAAAGPRMELSAFLEYVRTGRPLDTPAIHRLMDDMADEARRVTFRLNSAYHPMDEVRALLSELFGRPVPASLRVFPPLYADFGKNIHVGENVFINACCQFQDHGGVYLGDGCQIGHGVVFATLNHPLARSERRHTVPAPIRLGRDVWVGSNATILPGVSIGDGAVVGAGAVVTRDVPPDVVVAGVPARVIKAIG